ncbi:M24 family metallopeptidase [Planctomycetes bacterium K23_9]|uniref:Putative peptidase n=1 Tax=Stieleria marina TaxID=1930275 RepID=A0A517NZ75_9BACT|nr:putative peptidase [Planctomycetes bacterium K23_9]
MTKRIEKVVSQLEGLQADAMLVTNEINVSYLSGFSGDSSYLLITPNETTIISDGRYETQIADECPDLKTTIRYSGERMIDSIKDVIGAAGAKRVAVEAEHLTLNGFRGFGKNIDSVQWVETSGVVEALRMIKDECEIEIIRKSIQINEQTFLSVVAKLRRDWTEREIAHEFEATMRFLGAEGVSFVPIIGADAAGALPHYTPSPYPIGDAATLLIDWGAFYKGYASDMTRTLHQDHASDKFRSAYQAVLDSQVAAIQAIRPGVKASEVDAVARGVLQEAGLADAFVHGLGHGIGLQIHEGPRMSSISTETLQTGMVVTVEPGVYFAGEFGIRIEDDILVTSSGHEVLSHLPKGLDECRIML